MTHVLIIISFVAMGGPKATTPTIDHIPFASMSGCLAAQEWVTMELKHNKVHVETDCQQS